MLYLRNTNQLQTLGQEIVRGTSVTPVPPGTCSVLIPALTSSDATLKVWLDAGYTASYTNGASVWTDMSGNGNNVFLSGSLSYDACTGSIVFPGLTSSYAGTSTATNLDPGTGTISSEVWYRTQNILSPSDYLHVYQVGYMDVSGSLAAYSTEYGPAGWTLTNPWSIVSRVGVNQPSQAAPTSLATGTYPNISSSFNDWTQVVMTRNGTSLKQYVNGVLSASSSFTAQDPSNTNLLRLGLANELDQDRQFDAPFSGSISSLKIWIGKELTSTEVSASYAYMKGRYGK